ncbi:MAG TPA: hypothetical protein VF707_10435 [Ardenticatenaceae bacterium]
MIQKELVETLRALNRADKLHVMQLLVSELAREEIDLIQPGLDYPVWSPYAAFEAGDAMLEVLAAEAQDHA